MLAVAASALCRRVGAVALLDMAALPTRVQRTRLARRAGHGKFLCGRPFVERWDDRKTRLALIVLRPERADGAGWLEVGLPHLPQLAHVPLPQQHEQFLARESLAVD